MAFDQWKNTESKNKEVLMSKKYKDLQGMSVQISDRLDKVYAEEDYKEDTIIDLTNQRDMLLKAFVGS